MRLALCLSILVPSSASAEFLISEILADNSGTTLSDENGFPADWIEIQNPEGTAASVGGYYLTDDPADLTKWTLPDVTIGPNGYLLVFATGKDRAVAGSQLHANFALGAGGEFLALVHPDGETLVSAFNPEFPKQLRDISYGIGSGGPATGADFFLFGDEITYLVPGSDIGSDWQTPTFDDAAWALAHTPIGWGYSSAGGNDAFDIAPDGNLTTPMKGQNASVYVRAAFQITDPAEIVSLTLKMKVDDGFVAFLNGTQVAEFNAPDTVAYNSRSLGREEVDDAEDYDYFPLNFAGKLVPGKNILAIQGLNDSESSSDFVLIPELVGEIQDLSGGPQLGYFEKPTPGLPNSILSSSPPNLVGFSVPSQAFTQTFQLALSVANPSAVIRYTTNGDLPSNDASAPSPLYTAPITIDQSILIRARAFITGAIEGPGRTEGYMKLDSSQENFSSDLPVVMLSTFGEGGPPSPGSLRKDVFMLIYEPDEITGRTTLTGIPALATRGGFRKRGSSSVNFDKYGMSFESWDEFDEDKDIKPLGFSPEGDWILNSRYTFDMALIRNPFLYELSNQIGRWAVKTQMIEIFNDISGGDVSSTDYFGVYCFMEKIEPDKGRLDIPDLNPWDNAEPEITGGYVLRKDRGTTSINVGGQGAMLVNDPEPLSPSQKIYIEGFLNEMDAALSQPDGINPTTGKHFSEYLDVSAWIDSFWLNILSMDPDWGRLSQYYFKDRDGLVQGGPIWDYDRTMGSRDNRDDNPRRWDSGNPTWYASNYPWWGKLFGFTNNNQPTPGASSTRPDVMQQVIDRWYKLRSGEFSQANMDAIIDVLAGDITEAQARSFARWTGRNPGSIQGQSFAEPGTSGWEREISHLSGWLRARSEWIDEQFFIPPTLNQNGGLVQEGFQLTMFSDEGTVYYTLDGSDPRAPGGGIAVGAIPFDGGPVDEVLLPEDSMCRYFVPVDASLGVTWTLPAVQFDDSAWILGQSGLGFDSSLPGLTSEINTDVRADMRPEGGEANATCYVRYEFDFDNADSINSLTLRMKYDDGFVAYINGTQVTTDRAPALPQWDSRSEGGTRADSESIQFADFDISASKSAVVNGTNVLAIHGMHNSPVGSDFLVDVQLEANHTVVATPIVLNESASVVARASDGQQWGAPVTASFVVGAELADSTNLVISQIMYNPIGASAAEIDAGFADGDFFEYIELLNISDNPVDLSSVSFTAGITFDFFGKAVSSIGSGERVLIVRDQAAFEQRYGNGFNALIAGEFANNTALANGGERLALVGANGIIRGFSYNDRYPWPESPDGDGPALVLIAPSSNPDHAVGSNWRASVGSRGSVGAGDSTTFSGDPSLDGDADGLNAFAEYAFGTSDSNPAGGRGILQASLNDDGFLSVTFPKNLAADDALITVEISSDLATWMPAADMLDLASEVHNGDGTATFKFEAADPITPAEDLFVRLKVTSR